MSMYVGVIGRVCVWVRACIGACVYIYMYEYVCRRDWVSVCLGACMYWRACIHIHVAYILALDL